MMKRVILSLLSLGLSTATQAATTGGYLFATFRGEASPMTEQVYFMVSSDGRDWEATQNYCGRVWKTWTCRPWYPWKTACPP